MNNKICANCNQLNQPEMLFCGSCGAALSPVLPNEPPPTMMAGNFGAFSQSEDSYQSSNYQQPNFQQPNFQSSNFQAAPVTSGGQMKKILLGVGGFLVGLVMLASGGVKLYRAFGGSSSDSTPTISSTPQNLLSNTNSGNMSSSSVSNMNTAQTTSPPSSASWTIANLTQPRVGDWNLRDTVTGNPEKDGFAGAREEKQLKYFNSSQAMIHLTLAEYPSEIAAKNTLRTAMEKFKNLKLKVGEETVAGDNNQNEIGITQTMAGANGKIFTRYWTNKNILCRALGTQTDVESFFRKSEY